MTKKPTTDKLLQELDDKYKAIHQNRDVHLEGLLHSNSITYWDYIHTDALLGLQIQRTNLPDEMVFIAYHQINELIFKMILWEIKQVAEAEPLIADVFQDKLMRISRYFDMLTTSFNVMREGMDVAQYNKFRHTLTPASGFQSAQYRKIEFASTELINLIDIRFRANIDRTTPFGSVRLWIIIGTTMNMLKMPIYTPVRAGGIESASMMYGFPIRLAQPRPMPIIGRNSQFCVVIPGIVSIAVPAASIHSAWTLRAPHARVTGTSAKAPTKAMKL